MQEHEASGFRDAVQNLRQVWEGFSGPELAKLYGEEVASAAERAYNRLISDFDSLVGFICDGRPFNDFDAHCIEYQIHCWTDRVQAEKHTYVKQLYEAAIEGLRIRSAEVSSGTSGTSQSQQVRG